MEHTILLHRGEKFAARGAGLFLKDVMHDGTWLHPVTNRVIEVTPAHRASIHSNMAAFIAAGNKVPMPDGHTMDTERNKGFWPGPFVAMGEDVLAIAQPLNEKTKEQLLDGTADAVSVCWYPEYLDSHGTKYKDIFEHICLTNYPVIDKQRGFIALSGKQADANAPMLSKLMLDAVVVDETDEALVKGLEKVYNALRQGAGHRDVDDLARTPAERLAMLMSKCPVK